MDIIYLISQAVFSNWMFSAVSRTPELGKPHTSCRRNRLYNVGLLPHSPLPHPFVSKNLSVIQWLMPETDIPRHEIPTCYYLSLFLLVSASPIVPPWPGPSVLLHTLLWWHVSQVSQSFIRHLWWTRHAQGPGGSEGSCFILWLEEHCRTSLIYCNVTTDRLSIATL